MYISLVRRVREGFAQRKDKESSSSTLPANADVVEASQIVQCLTQEPTSTSPPVYRCRYKFIRGKFDLSYRTIETAVDIQNCIFLDEGNKQEVNKRADYKADTRRHAAKVAFKRRVR
jgi:hypothetical protein